VGLVLIFLIAISIWLTPERLGKLVSEYAGDYIEADVRVDSIDISVWSTFPYLSLDVNRVEVISKRLKKLTPSEREKLPEYCDTLASFNSFHGSISPFKLIFGRISLKDVSLDGLAVNLVAYNDSIDNYSIIPPSEDNDTTPTEIPYFSFKSVKLTNTKPIRYYSASETTRAQLNLNEVSFLKDESGKNQYALNINGDAGLQVDSLHVLDNFPFEFEGNVHFDFDPFKVILEKYNVHLANVKSEVSLDLDMGDESTLTSLTTRVSPFSLLGLFEYLPASLLPDLSGIKSDMMVEASIRMTEPYDLSSSILPSFAIDMQVPNSYLTYTLAGVGTYEMKQILLSGTFFFNGKNPDKSSMKLTRFSLAGDGVDLDVNGEATSVLDNPLIKMNVEGNVDFGSVMKYLPSVSDFTVKGKLACEVNAQFNLNDIIDGRISEVQLQGQSKLDNFLFKYPAEGIDVYGNHLTMNFGSDKVGMKDNIVSDKLALNASVDTITFAVPGISGGVGNLIFRGGVASSILTATAANKNVIPFAVLLSAGNVRADSEADSTLIIGKSLTAKGSVMSYEGNSKVPLLNLGLDASSLVYRTPLMFVRAKEVNSNLTAHIQPRGKTTTKKTRYQQRYDSIAKANPNISADSVAVLAQRKHRNDDSRTTVGVELDKGLKDLIKQWQVSGSLKVKKGVFASYMYPAKTKIRNLNMDFSFDSIALHGLHVRSQSNSLKFSGTISNLRKLMLGKKRTPVKVRLNAEIDTVNVNEIAATYEKGQRIQKHLEELGIISLDEEQVEQSASIITGLSQDDSLTYLIPQNIDAIVRVRAANAYYTDLHLYDAGTMLYVNDGVVSIDSLHAATDFGSAYLNLLYSTRNPQDINMSVDVGFDRIDVNTFFNRFHSLLEMVPQMDNLNGYVSAKAAASFNLFSNMDLDFPSLKAVVDVRGSDLRVRQDDLIRKVARMLLIRSKSDILLNNMVVQVSIHDNLLELYPFLFEFDRYQLGVMGENDFAGNMFYHVSVLKSPIPFKFGINIKGNFDKYKIRFGGAKFKSAESTRLMNIVDDRRVNLVREMRFFLKKMVHKAALSDTGSPGNNMLKNGGEADDKTVFAKDSFPKAPIKYLLENKDLIRQYMENSNSESSKK
jgi:hypothetical protein